MALGNRRLTVIRASAAAQTRLTSVRCFVSRNIAPRSTYVSIRSWPKGGQKGEAIRAVINLYSGCKH